MPPLFACTAQSSLQISTFSLQVKVDFGFSKAHKGKKGNVRSSEM